MALEIRRKYLVPEVTIYHETLLEQHETDQSKSCLCPESSLYTEEIKKKLMNYNTNLQNKHMQKFGYSGTTNECTRRLKIELEELIPSIFTPELLPHLQSFLVADACSYMQLIFHHVLAKLEHSAREQFFNSADTFHNTWYNHLKCYFDLYYEDINPEVSFDLIHKVWKYHPCIEFKLRLICCNSLIENKHYDILDQLIRNNEEYFLSSSKEYKESIVEAAKYTILYATHITVLLRILCYYVTSRQKAKVKTVFMFIKQMISKIHSFSSGYLSIEKIFNNFMVFTLRKKQKRLMPLLIKVLQPVLNRPDEQYDNLEIISLFNARLMEVNCHKEAMEFIKDNSHFILSAPVSLNDKCDFRLKHCILLLSLLHAYEICEDLTNMNHVLKRLLEFRQSLLSQTNNNSCYCFMGKRKCKHGPGPVSCVRTVKSDDEKNFQMLLRQQINENVQKRESPMQKGMIMKPNNLICIPVRHQSLEPGINNISSLNPLMHQILEPIGINRKIELISYLRGMINILKDNIGQYKIAALEAFSLLILELSVQNETVFHDMIEILCFLQINPEIQDMFIQGLTEVLFWKLNKQYCILSRLLLDINMTCFKGEFLQKMTINMGKHLLSLEEDTLLDVDKVIYRCFCIVRHENKETDIAKYKVHFAFISTMDAEEEMLKLFDLRSFLLMLILLIISSGGLHTSANLKKYLSLKYAYEDAILYLLWCSGDVEINPGPTVKKLEKQADSVKKRNWIHVMCTISLKLLKNKAVDSKSDGLWKEKPDSWQELHADKPFYDPRNKQKSKKFSIKTDEELLNCLLKCCDWKSLRFPSNFQREIDAWKSDRVLLLELCVTRQEIDAIKKEKELLIMYEDTAELKQQLKNCNICISFNPTHVGHSKGYSDMVRDLAITFCRISKGLPILVKSDGIWKTQPYDWNPNDLYYSPCNTGERQEKHQDQKLVDNLLFYCERKSISIPSELQLVVKAWKLRNSHEICKHYTIWSCMAIIKHSIKYLGLEGLLEKPHVQQSLKQIGVSLHCEKGPKHLNSESKINTDNESKVSGLPNSSISDNQRGIHSSSPSSSASDLDSVCSQHPYQARALPNSNRRKYVITCPKPDFQNQPCTSSCSIYSKRAPCQEKVVNLQSTDERLDLTARHTSLYVISCEEPDLQPTLPGSSIFTERAQCQKVRNDLPSKNERIQKRKRAISEERLHKKSARQSGNESQASTSSITRCNGDTTPSSHCDLDIADQCVHSTDTEEEVDQDPSSNIIPVQDNKRKRSISEERSDKILASQSGNESQASTSSITRSNVETTLSSHCDLDSEDQSVERTVNTEEDMHQDLSSNRTPVPDNQIQDTDSSNDELFGSEDEIPNHLLEYLDTCMSCDNLEEELEHIDRQLKLWETL